MSSGVTRLHLSKSHGKSEDFNFLTPDFRVFWNRFISFLKAIFQGLFSPRML